MADATRGLPLLSGPPPIVEEPNRHGCRRCGKEFGLLTRSRSCNHCGFSYCLNCSDNQALMPRGNPESREHTGYEAVPVCAYCIPNLLITAGGRGQLRSMPVSHLRAYTKAYGLSLPQNVLEKGEIIEAIVSARGSNGCLPADNEEYYRRHSVPNKTPERRHRSLFTRMADAVSNAASAAQSAAGPPPRPNQQTRPNAQAPRTNQSSHPQYRHPQAQSHYTAPPPNEGNPYAYRPPSSTAPPRATRSRPSQPHPDSQPPQPPPNRPTRTPSPSPPLSIDELLNMTHNDLHKLSVGTLKAILWDNHAVVGQVLEKDDLVNKVETLLENERADREREARLRAEEEQAYIERQARMREEWRRREAENEAARKNEERRMSVDGLQGSEVPSAVTEAVPEIMVNTVMEDQEYPEQEPPRPRSAEPGTASTLPIPTPSPTPSAASAPPSLSSQPGTSPSKPTIPTIERSGLCAICQDEEANMVVVDCGHLAMCRSCSDLVMNSSRECPLCRTRIVTPQRLLRVFRT